MPLKATDAERGEHARRRAKEANEVLQRAWEGGAFEGISGEEAIRAKAMELVDLSPMDYLCGISSTGVWILPW